METIEAKRGRLRFQAFVIMVCCLILFCGVGSFSYAAAPGDANNDGKISQADLTTIIDHFLGGATPPGNPDCNSDSGVNIQDVICVINILSTQPPPDPGEVAPPIDPTVATTVASGTEFLYTGANPIQSGVMPGTIEVRRAAVMRGKVLDRHGNPLPLVNLTILNHPEYGQTKSRADGMFDMAVNGGGFLTVNYEKSGYLPAQRQVNVPWQDFVWLPEVIMIPVDTQVTTIDLTNPDPIQVARGSVVTDNAGSRQATVLFSSGTTATLVKADGTTQEMTTLNVRATEYTVGSAGPKAMPAELPPTSGYTYCVDLSADEALSAGANTVQFSQPVINYLENYLQARVGSIVPVGYYDRIKGLWVPSENGRVIKILNISGGVAEVDTDGDNVADNGLGITDAERQRLAILYTVGQSLWRVPISHFSPWDYNWPYGPPPGATPPNQPPPKKTDYESDPCKEGSSIIECQNQTLGEAIDIAGTPFRLHYQSARVPGKATIEIPLSGDTVPDSLTRIDLEIYIAGRKFTHSLSRDHACLYDCAQLGSNQGTGECSPPTPPGSDVLTNRRYIFPWDGKDAYGRILQGTQPVTVRIGYSYCAVYMEPAGVGRSFGAFSGIPITGSRALRQFTLWQEWRTSIGNWDARAHGLGGWTLSVHHAYDPNGRILHLGDGEQRAATGLSTIITTVAGTGTSGYGGDGGQAKKAFLNAPWDVDMGPDGALYIADLWNNRIRRIKPDRIIDTVAGTGTFGYSGDNGLATQAKLNRPVSVAITRDGGFYIADSWNYRIRRVGSDGIITTVAGDGTCGYSGDGGPARLAKICYPSGLSLGPDGSLYFADEWANRIRRIGMDRIITTVAGNGTKGYSGDGGPATQAQLNGPIGTGVGPDGSLYIADGLNHRIRRVWPD